MFSGINDLEKIFFQNFLTSTDLANMSRHDKLTGLELGLLQTRRKVIIHDIWISIGRGSHLNWEYIHGIVFLSVEIVLTTQAIN